MLPAKAENRNKAMTSVLRMSGHVIVKRLHVRKTVFRMRKKIILINQRGRHLGPDSNWMPIYVHTRPFTNNRERRKQFRPKF